MRDQPPQSAALRTISQRDYQLLIDALNALKDQSEAQQAQIAQLTARPVNVNHDALGRVVVRALSYAPLVVIVFLLGTIAGLLLAGAGALLVAGLIVGVVLLLGLPVKRWSR